MAPKAAAGAVRQAAHADSELIIRRLDVFGPQVDNALAAVMRSVIDGQQQHFHSGKVPGCVTDTPGMIDAWETTQAVTFPVPESVPCCTVWE